MKSIILSAVAAGAVLLAGGESAHADGKKKIACTLPTVEAIVKEVGGDKVETFSLAAGDQDPHFVSPTPSLMKRVRGADMLFEIGMQLETWADQVADGSGNSRIFKGGPGRVQLATGIPKLEVPSSLSRAQGDIHPEGNPHVWLDPVRAKMMAENAARALKAADPANASYYDARLKAFQKKIDRALFGDELLKVVGSRKLSRLALDGRLGAFLDSNDYQGVKLSQLAGGWLARARPLRGQKVVEFHKVWVYFASTFGFELIGTIEEKPGIAPGPRHVKDTIDKVKASKVKLILVDNFYDPALPRRVAKEGGAKAVMLPNQVRGEKGVTDYVSLMNHVIDAMVAASK
ncbi:MAG TPA: metal ABC transporter substrate-binding protein [Kofleriaceae bacterium]|nr:metal ABC transporter substrate-binding protein [Kofleriaceae bacterium]